MTRVEIDLNGRPYAFGCPEGQESRLKELATFVDSRLRAVAPAQGLFSESQRLALTLLTLADQVLDLRADLTKLRAREKTRDRVPDSKGRNATTPAAEAPAPAVTSSPAVATPPAPVFTGLDPKTEERYATFVEHLAARIDSVASRLARV